MRTRPTELANRTRFASWRRRIDKPLVGGQKGAVTRLRAVAGEVGLRSQFGKYAQDLSKLVDSGQTVVSGMNPLKHATGGEVQLSSELGRWMPKTTT